MKPARRERTLAQLAKDIRRNVEAADAHWASAVEAAIAAGQDLTEVKARLEHGKWLPWLEANFPKDATTARDYMRLAAHADEIEGAPSLRRALRELAPSAHTSTTESATDRLWAELEEARAAEPQEADFPPKSNKKRRSGSFGGEVHRGSSMTTPAQQR